MIKIKLKPNWTTSEEITKRALLQFFTNNNDLNNIKFVYDDSYDVIVFFNYISESIKRNSKTLLFPHEPTWTGNHQKNICNIDNITLFGFDKNDYPCLENIKESIAYTFYGGRGPYTDGYDDWTYNKSIEYNGVVKTKAISSIVTTLNYTTFGERCLYPQRYNLINQLIKEIDFVDFYGGWVGNENLKTSPLKIDATLPYKFCLGIENEYHKNWITEKFYDSIICNTIPIYYGCPNIKEIYPEDGYILLETIEDPKYVQNILNYVNKNIDKLYYDKLPNLLKIKQKYFSEYNLLKKIIIECK